MGEDLNTFKMVYVHGYKTCSSTRVLRIISSQVVNLSFTLWKHESVRPHKRGVYTGEANMCRRPRRNAPECATTHTDLGTQQKSTSHQRNYKWSRNNKHFAWLYIVNISTRNATQAQTSGKFPQTVLLSPEKNMNTGAMTGSTVFHILNHLKQSAEKTSGKEIDWCVFGRWQKTQWHSFYLSDSVVTITETDWSGTKRATINNCTWRGARFYVCCQFSVLWLMFQETLSNRMIVEVYWT